MTNKIKCCPDMKAAQERGTDNEGYGPLVYIATDGVALMGCDLKPIKFCPWCKKLVKVTNG